MGSRRFAAQLQPWQVAAVVVVTTATLGLRLALGTLLGEQPTLVIVEPPAPKASGATGDDYDGDPAQRTIGLDFGQCLPAVLLRRNRCS